MNLTLIKMQKKSLIRMKRFKTRQTQWNIGETIVEDSYNQ